MYSITSLVVTVVLLVVCAKIAGAETKYEPNWESLDTRPIPTWFDEGKIGLMMLWGVFSVPGLESEWFWYEWRNGVKSYVNFMANNYRKCFTYPDFAPMFTTEFYNADEWAELISASGAKYVVFGTKHHEGYSMWPSKYSFNWNANDVGPKRDLVGELAVAMRRRGDVKFGVYYSLYEWYNGLYLLDKDAQYQTNLFTQGKMLPQMYELINNYQPEVFWSDGDWEATSVYWNVTNFLAWLYNESPVKDSVVVNDRWGSDCRCKHGGYLTCKDRFNPKVLQKFKYENCESVDRQGWGYRRQISSPDILNLTEIIQQLAETISCGGNLILNVGPTHDGRIIPIFEERLRQLGQWLEINGEGVYSTSPWSTQNDSFSGNVWYTTRQTQKGSAVYAFVMEWPANNTLQLYAPMTTTSTVVTLLGYNEKLKWTSGKYSGIYVHIPDIPLDKMPSKWAWIFKFTGLKPE